MLAKQTWFVINLASPADINIGNHVTQEPSTSTWSSIVWTLDCPRIWPSQDTLASPHEQFLCIDEGQQTHDQAPTTSGGMASANSAAGEAMAGASGCAAGIGICCARGGSRPTDDSAFEVDAMLLPLGGSDVSNASD